MSTGATVAIIGAAAIIVIALIVAFAIASRRRKLQQLFGPEYDRALAENDSRHQAEAELARRQRRVRKLQIRPLSPAARSRYEGEWQAIQEQFVDAPQTAATEAYTLVTTVMRERGYPVTDDEQVAHDLSVEHARTVDHFRSAQAVTREVAHGSVTTEDLRQAFIHYRDVLADLLGGTDDDAAPGLAASEQAAQAPEPSSTDGADADLGEMPANHAVTEPAGISAIEPSIEPGAIGRQADGIRRQ